MVDDLSTDNTDEIINQWVNKDKRFRYIRNERKKGAQGARNTGIIYAQYSWIAFNDSDDEWLTDKLEKQIKILEKNNFESDLVIYGDCYIKDYNAGTTTLWNLDTFHDEKPLKFFLNNSSFLFQTILLSKKSFTDIGLLDEDVPSYQEWDSAIRLSKGCRFVHIPEPLFIYHKHQGETISKDFGRDIKGSHYIRMKFRKEFIENYSEDFFRYHILKNIHRIISGSYWELGTELLEEVKDTIPYKTYLFWKACFKLKLDPEQGRKLAVKNILRRIKHKIHD